MSICTNVLGSGLGGAIGKTALNLAGALGLLGAVDSTTKLITGYGLFEALTVPYIECEDGHFASAIEWYSNGMKCGEPPKPPAPGASTWDPPGSSASASTNRTVQAIQSYMASLPPGFDVRLAFGSTALNQWRGGQVVATTSTGGHAGPTELYAKDKLGNTVKRGTIPPPDSSGYGGSNLAFPYFFFPGTFAPAVDINNLDSYSFYSTGNVSTDVSGDPVPLEFVLTALTEIKVSWGLMGVYVLTPNNKNAPKFTNPPGYGGDPSKNNRKGDCNDMSNCPCLTEEAIVRAVKKALGIDLPLMPEQAILNMGKKIFSGITGQVNLGKSINTIVPTSLLDAITALIAVSHFRNGLHRYPMVMPRSLIDDGIVANAAPDFIHENAELWEWWIKQFDAMMGEFPIDIKIKNGNSETPLKFENLAEALAELSGLIIQTATDADAAVNVGSRAVVEASKAGNAAIIAQRHALALIEFLGIKTDGEQIPVQSTITPGKLDQANNTNDGHGLKEFLQPSTQYVSVLKEVDEFDLKAVLQRLLQNSEIVRAAHWQEYNPEKPGKNKITGDYIRDQRKYDKSQANEGTLALKKEMEAKFNKEGSPVKIDIDRVLDGTSPVEIPGSNFVIRRQPPST